MALRPTRQLNKQQRKALTEQRRKERDASGKRKKKWEQEERRAAHSAAQTHKQATDPALAKRRVEAQFTSNLLNELRTRLVGAISIEGPLYAVNPPLHLTFDHEVKSEAGVEAYTDFRTITLKVNEERVPSPYGDPSGLKDFVFSVKGLFHHEAGHILHSWPLWDMWREAEGSKGLDTWSINFFKRCDDLGVTGYQQLQQTWNGLEDQRMETARVRDFPVAQRYFEHMMGSFLLKQRSDEFWQFSAWALLAGREYLPAEIRQGAKEMFVPKAKDPNATAEEWLDLVRAYKAASTKEELLDALLDAHEWLINHDEEMPQGMDDHDSEGTATNGAQKAEGAATKPGEGEDGAGGTGEGTETPTEDPDVLTAGRGAGGAHFTDKDFQDQIRSLKNGELPQSDQGAVSNAMNTATNPGLRSYQGQTKPMSPTQVNEAIALQNGLTQALETYVTRATPHWVHRQDEGHLDPCAYRTREAGDTDYNIGMAGQQGEVLDLHVSVLADVSYSMSAHMPQLCTQLLGIKYACDELNIPSNFTLWSDAGENYRIYDSGPEEVVFPSLGGTNPTDALNDAVLQNEENRPNHLFLILTDGAWAGLDTILPWRKSNEQQFIIVKFGQGPHYIHGADALVDMPSLSKFPDLLRDALDNMLDAVV